MMSTLNILGASTRAAAMSAVAAGYDVWCADKFGDTDLQAIATVERCEHYPDDLPTLLSDAPHAPWIYTGALENYPKLLAQLPSRAYPLWGNTAEVVKLARDPEGWIPLLKTAGISVPTIAASADEVPHDGTWLVKPRRSAGGVGIARWDAPLAATASRDASQSYWQEFVAGEPCSAVFVAAGRRAVLLGSTRQLIGEPWCWGLPLVTKPQLGNVSHSNVLTTESTHAPPPFAYCGSLGPQHWPDAITAQWQTIGDVLARELNLVGLFGVDAILTANQRIVPLEINPRYTASIEVLERASQLGTFGTRARALRSIALHAAACTEGKLPERVIPVPNAVSGKAILYAPRGERPWRFPPAAAQWAAVMNLNPGPVSVADLPRADSLHQAGQPILTVLADGSDEAEVRGKLLDLASEFYELIEEE
jgi:predicted ATP-grasp superfamily ATP-dependent carboligase